MSKSSTVAQSKDAERLVADELKGRRLTAGEWRGRGDADVVGPGRHPKWMAQVKHRSNLPTYLTEGLKQIREAVGSSDTIPLVVIRTKPGRGRQAETLVVVDVETWNRVYRGGAGSGYRGLHTTT